MMRQLIHSVRGVSVHQRHLSGISQQPVAAGSLRCSRVFGRILGTAQQSETILLELLSAWRAAFTGDSSCSVTEVSIFAPGKQVGGVDVGVQGRGTFAVEARATDTARRFILSVQPRKEPGFTHRAIAYVADKHSGDLLLREQSPAHQLAFLSPEPEDSSTLPDPARVMQLYCLQPSPLAGPLAGSQVNQQLAQQVRNLTSSMFLHLAHAPLLQALTPATPPILKWAALLAHAHADNTGAVPREVCTPGVSRLLEVLQATAAVTREEVREELEEGRALKVQ